MATSTVTGLNKLTIIFPPGDQLTSVLIDREKDIKIEDLINRLCTLRGIELTKCKNLRILNEQGEKIDLSQTVGKSGVVFIDIMDKTTDKEEKKKLKEKDTEEYKIRPPPAHIKLVPGTSCYIPLEVQLYDDEKKHLQEAKKFEVSKYFSDEFIIAVLFSRKFDLKRTEEYLHSCIDFRKERGYLKLPRFTEIDKRLFHLSGYYSNSRDNEGRSIRFVRIYKTSPNANGQTIENLVKFYLWMAYVGIFHEGIDGLRNGCCVVADAEGYSWKQFDIDFQKQTSQLFMEKFPLLLRKLILINPPSIFSALLKIISTFNKNKILKRIEPVSRKEVCKFIPADQLPVEFGGTAQYNTDDYIKILQEFAEKCEDRLIKASEITE